MTKETNILLWLSEYKPDRWIVKYFKDSMLYTIMKNKLVVFIKYDWNTIEHECLVSIKDGKDIRVRCVGTVEVCLDYLKKETHVKTQV